MYSPVHISTLLSLTVLCASCVPAQGTGSAQVAPDTAATEVVRRYLEAMRSKNWVGCALLTHPEELSRIRREFLPVFASDSSGRLAEQILGVAPQLRVASLDSIDLVARLFAFYV